MAVQPLAEIVALTSAELIVILLTVPLVMVGVVFTPLPVAATLILGAPPPPTGIFPL